uniref:Ovule protein n=1 Tax=Echinococcus granulosus TaxID=6210 RepID=A0A068WGT4_ECHGR|nr:hypothetical protein EgrG_000949900 [Echinococcus granulosus]
MLGKLEAVFISKNQLKIDTHTNKRAKGRQDRTRRSQKCDFYKFQGYAKKMNEVRGGQSVPGEEEENTQMWVR